MQRGGGLDAAAETPSLARSRRAVVGLAVVLRLVAFPFAENHQGDAPMRTLLAERMNADPAAAADARSFRQFGPLAIEAMRPFLAAGERLGGDARWWSRLPSLLAGLAVFAPFFALARRLTGGGPAVVLAGLALALSPLHIQASTTATSEALYLLLLVAACERLHAALCERRRRDFAFAGLLLSLAAVTRYDTWVALPGLAAAALVLGPRDRRALGDLAVLGATAAIFPAAFMWWSWHSSGDPLFAIRFISQTHSELASGVAARLGPVVARLRQVVTWTESFAAAMTPVALVAVAWAARGWRRLSAPTLVVLATALAPIAAYLVKGLGWGGFEPLPRFALGPGVILLPVASVALIAMIQAPRWPRPVPLVVTGALVMSGLVLVLAFALPGRIRTGAAALAPITRLDAEDRALADFLRQARAPGESVLIDSIDYADIAIAHAAGIPWGRSITVSTSRAAPRTLAASHDATGATWFAIHDDSWGRAPMPDWPADDRLLGHWRVAHLSRSRSR